MKYLGMVLAGGLALVIILIIGVFSFLPSSQTAEATATAPPVIESTPPQPTPVVFDTSQIEENWAQQASVYQEQIGQLDQALQERQVTYQSQIQQLTDQISAAQTTLNQLKSQEQTLLQQVVELEQARSERLALYQSQLAQAQAQYSARYSELQNQISQAQTQLAEANAQLGR